jgi:hypothetical protein
MKVVSGHNRSARTAGMAESEFPDLAGSGAYHRPIAEPGDNHRLAAQFGIIRCSTESTKCVQIDMDDFADGHLGIFFSRFLTVTDSYTCRALLISNHARKEERSRLACENVGRG